MSVATDSANRASSFFSDGLENWPNDDLLLTQDMRDHLRSLHPTVAQVLDWPEHRMLFEVENPAANTAKRTRRRIGIIALAAGILSILLTATSPILSGVGVPPSWLGIASAIAAAIGVCMGLYYLLGRTRMTWLTRRFRTERLRQFYFQFVLNNLDLATAAMSDNDALERWRSLRSAHLATFKRDVLEPVGASVSALEADVLLQDVWIEPAWKVARSVKSTPDLMLLLDVLWRQRFIIQRRYSLAKKEPRIGSPHLLAPYVKITADVAGGLIWLLTPVMALLLSLQLSVSTPPLLWVIVASAILGVVVSGLRAIDGSFQLQAEVDRTDWYLAAVESLNGGFETASAAEKVARLRRMEELSYEEMRRFIVGQKSAGFIM